MNIFLDTTQTDFVACLFDENYNSKKQQIITTKHKVEEITNFFNNLLIEYKLKINDIKNFYINLGPGSFTGSRIALVYVRTIAQITNAKILTTNSFKLLGSEEEVLFLSANKNKSFQINLKNINNISETKLVDKSTKEKEINYKALLSSFKDKLILFEEEKDILKIKPKYGSMPQIGGGN